MLAKQAWDHPQILDECPDVVPLLIVFTDKTLLSLDDGSEDSLVKRDKDAGIEALSGILEQVWMVVDARMDVDEMQDALETLGARVMMSAR